MILSMSVYIDKANFRFIHLLCLFKARSEKKYPNKNENEALRGEKKKEKEVKRKIKRKKNVVGSGGIRTHASEETGALNQRLRPLGHATNTYKIIVKLML